MMIWLYTLYQVKIPLEESLSINPFVSKDEKTPPGKYHLRGVVHHVGNSALSGHYTACGKRTLKKGENSEEQWVFFDDPVGTKKDLGWVTSTERNQRNCYMAVYESDINNNKFVTVPRASGADLDSGK